MLHIDVGNRRYYNWLGKGQLVSKPFDSNTDASLHWSIEEQSHDIFLAEVKQQQGEGVFNIPEIFQFELKTNKKHNIIYYQTYFHFSDNFTDKRNVFFIVFLFQKNMRGLKTLRQKLRRGNNATP